MIFNKKIGGTSFENENLNTAIIFNSCIRGNGMF